MTDISNYMENGNLSTAFPKALAAALQGDRVLRFPAGEYHFFADGCAQKYCYFSNNDEGVKTIAMLLENIDGLTIAGDHTRLIFHGRISPLCAFNCRNLRVSGLTIDFEDSFVSDADLVERRDGVAWFRFSGRHKVENGKLVFTGDFYDNLSGTLPFYAYSAERGELDFATTSISVANRGILWKDGLAGVEDKFAAAGTNAFVVKHELRLCPGMVFDHCGNVQLEKVTLHHAAGMGFLLQCCDGCTVVECEVSPSTRRASVSDDALHIAECRGKIRIANCRLSGTLDDSINVHGAFRKLKMRLPGGKMYYAESGHFQQQGIDGIRAGDTLEVRRRSSGKPYAELHVAQVRPLTKALTKIDFDESELPAGWEQGDPVWSLETQAELEIVNTFCAPLRGRGILASGMKKIRISGCHLHASGAGVFISGDHGYWYETGPVANALIENNFFDHCAYDNNAATQEVLAVFPELPELEKDFYYHGKIAVQNNRFCGADAPLVSMLSVAEAIVRDNEFIADDRYRFVPRKNAGYYFTTAASPQVAFKHCGKIIDENNLRFRRG